jgi:hypothetical protein
MKKENLPIYLIAIAILISLFVVASASAASIDTCVLNVTLVNQDPYPAIPGEYVDLVFQISNAYSDICKGAKFQLVPTYPFSLDQNDPWRTLDQSTTVAGYNKDWMIAYKVRVDKNAVSGDNEITAYYGSGSSDLKSYAESKFIVPVEDSRTNFDAVIQEVSGSDVSIAIANTGKYAANSVIVRIPQQDNFRATGTDGQMVGNLDSGDYTIVSFTLANAMPRNATRTPSANQGFQNLANNLKFDISYTDTLGERRTVNMELPLTFTSGSNSTSFGNFPGRSTSSSSTKTIWYYWAAIILVFLIVFIYRKKSKKSSSTKNDSSPDWIKNDRKKEKKRYSQGR